ncbi:3D domain-containing protein [Carnobacterium gallinarum]|uniref:3D domain-containing protein n=1 Tax=Carnobacterium gallinarum TaxID=2749 RepID=UPI0005504CC1|nr:3D domain-containing protein [Carnobacterium gallinarum]
MKLRKLVVYTVLAFFSVNLIANVGHAASLDEISKAQQEKKASIVAVDSEISQTLVSLNDKNQEIENLNQKITEKQASLTDTAEKIKAKQANIDERITQAKKRLQTLQTSEANKSMILMILQSENVTDFLSRAYMIATLQSADTENLQSAKKEQDELSNLEEKLREDATTLASQKEQVSKDTTDLNSKMASLQKTMDENKGALDALDAQKATEQTRLNEEAAKKKQAEELAKQAEAAKVSTVATAAPAASPTETPKNDVVAPTPAPANPTDQSGAGGAGRSMIVSSTGYSYTQAGLGFFTSNGTDLRVNSMVIAVDPRVIPIGTRVEIPGYGVAIAADTGGAIKGNKIDIHFPTVAECLAWGRRTITIKILD